MKKLKGIDSQLLLWVKDFLKKRGIEKEEFELMDMEGDGSLRSFFRLRLKNQSFVLTVNPPINAFIEKENISYLKIGKHLKSKGIPVPEIFEYNLRNGWFLLEDLGDSHLQDIEASQKRAILYEKTIEMLFFMQLHGREGFDTNWCYQTKTYNRDMVLKYEAEYFLNEFLINYAGMNPEKEALFKVFHHISDKALVGKGDFFMHRDFQSRNIMVKGENRIYFVDWQGGRLGPLGYDLASLLIDPYMELTENEKGRLYNLYLDFIKTFGSSFVAKFEDSYPYLSLQRNMQILGAFSFLGIKRGKQSFLKYIPSAIRSFQRQLEDLKDPVLSPLQSILEKAKQTTSMSQSVNL